MRQCQEWTWRVQNLEMDYFAGAFELVHVTGWLTLVYIEYVRNPLV